MSGSSKPMRLADACRFPGFRPRAMLHGVFGDRKARVITLVRRSKKRSAARAGRCITARAESDQVEPYPAIQGRPDLSAESAVGNRRAVARYELAIEPGRAFAADL